MMNEISNMIDPVLPANEVTIVITTADRVEMVYECIRDFLPHVPEAVELLVVDAGVNDHVDETIITQLWRASRVLRSPRRNMCLQRNMAMKAACGKILCFIDDDAAIQSGWWPAIVKPFNDPRVGAVAGAVWSSVPPKLSDKQSGYVNRFGGSIPCNNRGVGHPQYVDYGVGANTAYRRHTLVELGGFAEIFGIYDEDIDLGLRMQKAGWKIVYAYDAPVYHHQGRSRPRVMTKQKQFLLGRNRALLLYRNYGFFSRLLLAFFALPLLRLWCALCETVRFGWTKFGHVAAFWAGMLKGVWVGMHHDDSVRVRNRNSDPDGWRGGCVSLLMAGMVRWRWVERLVVRIGHHYSTLPGYWRIVRDYPACLRASGKDTWRWTKTEDGIWMYVDAADRMHGKFWYWNVPYEGATTAFIRSRLNAGDVFLDVGANMGYFTLMAAKMVGTEGTVLAFEPNPALVKAVRLSINRNGWTARAVVDEIALSDRTCDAREFYLSADTSNSGLSSFSENWAQVDSTIAPQQIMIKCSRFDEWVTKNPITRLDMVKIDVEGAETACLRGMLSSLNHFKPDSIICETADQSEAHRILEGLGYQGERSAGTLNGIYRRSG